MRDEYGEAIAGISGRVSWWRFGEAAGATTAIDEQGTQNGAYQGGATLGQTPLPPDTDDTDVALNGAAAFIEVTHHASYNLTAGTIVGWFRATDLTGNRTLLSKDAAGIQAGDFILWWVPGPGHLRFQLEDATTTYQANGAVSLLADTTYSYAIQWGSGGMKLYLASAGQLQLVASNAYTGGISNAQNLRIGATRQPGRLLRRHARRHHRLESAAQ